MLQVLLTAPFAGNQLMFTTSHQLLVHLLLHDDSVPSVFPVILQTTSEMCKDTRYADVRKVMNMLCK
jgi:hypothetical protein